MTSNSTTNHSALCSKAQQHPFLYLGKRSHLLQNSVLAMNLNILKERFGCSEIFPSVRLNLLRLRDQTRTKRSKIGAFVAEGLQASLDDSFTGHVLHSKLVLKVNVTVVSDGRPSHTRTTWNNITGKYVKDRTAKLSVTYSLYCRQTGAVVVSKQVSVSQEYQTEPPTNDFWWDMMRGISNTIYKEISFACCSRIPGWEQFASELLLDNVSIRATSKNKVTAKLITSIAETESCCSGDSDDLQI